MHKSFSVWGPPIRRCWRLILACGRPRPWATSATPNWPIHQTAGCCHGRRASAIFRTQSRRNTRVPHRSQASTNAFSAHWILSPNRSGKQNQTSQSSSATTRTSSCSKTICQPSRSAGRIRAVSEQSNRHRQVNTRKAAELPQRVPSTGAPGG
jgi:hypothetical protein